MSTYRDNVLKQLQDGKRSWVVTEVPGGDLDLFMVTVVEPLRELKQERVVDDIYEHPGAYRGRMRVDLARIIGDVHFPNAE